MLLFWFLYIKESKSIFDCLEVKVLCLLDIHLHVWAFYCFCAFCQLLALLFSDSGPCSCTRRLWPILVSWTKQAPEQRWVHILGKVVYNMGLHFSSFTQAISLPVFSNTIYCMLSPFLFSLFLILVSKCMVIVLL